MTTAIHYCYFFFFPTSLIKGPAEGKSGGNCGTLWPAVKAQMVLGSRGLCWQPLVSEMRTFYVHQGWIGAALQLMNVSLTSHMWAAGFLWILDFPFIYSLNASTNPSDDPGAASLKSGSNYADVNKTHEEKLQNHQRKTSGALKWGCAWRLHPSFASCKSRWIYQRWAFNIC